MGEKVKILLVDDHEVLRDGLAALIDRHTDMEIVAAVGSGSSAVRLAREMRPDVVVMDIGLPDLNGIDATRQITDRESAPRVLCLSVHREQNLIGEMFHAGATGYLVKNCAGRELVDAIRTVASGQTYISPAVAGDVVQEYVRGRPHRGDSVYTTLSDREREVLQLIAEGCNTKDIAVRLGISEKTVAAHRLNLMRTLDIHSIADLTRYAIREGLVEP
jgi:DNA-binding NarL/FixJ family response regulator